jgi:hypothetical protein
MRSHSLTPVHSDVLTAHGPQLNPIDFLRMFSSLRRLPAHTSVTGSVTLGSATSSSIVTEAPGLPTSPPMSMRWVAQSRRGTAPWLRT